VGCLLIVRGQGQSEGKRESYSAAAQYGSGATAKDAGSDKKGSSGKGSSRKTANSLSGDSFSKKGKAAADGDGAAGNDDYRFRYSPDCFSEAGIYGD
jgi:hypothetical protein